MRYLLVDGQGNFGSVDGDAPAAMRYTEVRMSRIASELLADIEKETVDFVPNYDGSETEPSVMPARFPNLLVNGSSGIAVGMATNIPPHNLTEIINACLAVLDDPRGHAGRAHAARAGSGFPHRRHHQRRHRDRHRLPHRPRPPVDPRAHAFRGHRQGGGRQAIIVTELPYQVNKARLLERIAELVRNKEIDGISELRDESDKDGMRVVIELKRGEVAEVVLNNLFAQTPLETVFGINMVALIDGQPKLLGAQGNARGLPAASPRDRHAPHDFRPRQGARSRPHPRRPGGGAGQHRRGHRADQGFAVAGRGEGRRWLARDWNSGACRRCWRAPAPSPRARRVSPPSSASSAGSAATSSPRSRPRPFSTCACIASPGSSRTRSSPSTRSCWRTIVDLTDILARPERLTQVVREELIAIREQYGDARRTEINRDHLDLSTEDLIEPQDVVVTLSHAGYAKSQPVTEYQVQRRGGRGKAATSVKDEDFVEKLFVAHTHDTILCFSNRGKVYWKRVFELPQAGRGSRGKPMVNLLPLEEGEKINAVLPIKQFDDDHFVFMATQPGHGQEDAAVGVLAAARQRHHRASDLDTDDRLVGVALTDGTREIILFVERRQVDPLQRRRSAAHGPRGHRRARHQARRRARSSSR